MNIAILSSSSSSDVCLAAYLTVRPGISQLRCPCGLLGGQNIIKLGIARESLLVLALVHVKSPLSPLDISTSGESKRVPT
jgi:hypothetical protein